MSTEVVLDLTKTAALHSQLAGVLAGFAMTVLTVILAPRVSRAGIPPKNPRRSEADNPAAHLSVVLLCAVLSLIAVSFMFAVLAGGTPNSVGETAASREALSATAFAISILVMFYALIGVVEVANLPQTARRMRGIVAAVGSPIAMLFVSLSIVGASSNVWLTVVASWALPVIVLFWAFFLLWWRKYRKKSVRKWQRRLRWIPRHTFGVMSLVTVAILGAVSVLITRLPEWALWALTFVYFAVLLVQTLIIMHSRAGSPRRNP